MDHSSKGMLFLGMIILAMLFIFLTGPLLVLQNLPMVLVQLFGLLLILWALLAKGVNKQHKATLPSGFFFVDKGPYEIIRHPIYAGLLMSMSSLVQYEFTLLRSWAFLVLVVVVVCKIINEERIMNEKSKAYATYQQTTKRLIPYFF